MKSSASVIPARCPRTEWGTGFDQQFRLAIRRGADETSAPLFSILYDFVSAPSALMLSCTSTRSV